MNKNVNKAFNDQINREYYSAYLYLAMSEWLQQHGWVGSSKWMEIQYREEMAHAEGMAAWLRRHDGRLELQSIDAPKADFNSILDVFKEALEHERFVTEKIGELQALAEAEKDRASAIFLDWYVMEQVEEEENGRDNVMAIEAAGKDLSLLFSYDHHLGGREHEVSQIPYIS